MSPHHSGGRHKYRFTYFFVFVRILCIDEKITILSISPVKLMWRYLPISFFKYWDIYPKGREILQNLIVGKTEYYLNCHDCYTRDMICFIFSVCLYTSVIIPLTPIRGVSRILSKEGHTV